jgi:dihydroflavonol-4-reductase
MKVLVTGASGFIGGNLARQLVAQGYSVRALVRNHSSLKALEGLDIELAEGDLLEKETLEKALDGCEALFHVAAMYTFWAWDPKFIYETNVQGTENVILAAKAKGVKKIVYTSSESTIGIPEHCLGDEGGYGDISHIPGDYKKSKFLAENLVAKMCREGAPVVIVNPTTPIGPYDVKPTPTGKIVLGYLNHKMFACVNTGLNIIDVGDLAKGHILALEKGRVGERYVLGNKNMTLREIMAILEKITGIKAPRFDIPIRFALAAGYIDEFLEGKLLGTCPRIPVGAVKAARHFRYFDCTRAVKELGLPQTPVEESFKKATDWFKQNGYVNKSQIANRKSQNFKRKKHRNNYAGNKT